MRRAFPLSRSREPREFLGKAATSRAIILLALLVVIASDIRLDAQSDWQQISASPNSSSVPDTESGSQGRLNSEFQERRTSDTPLSSSSNSPSNVDEVAAEDRPCLDS